MHVRRLDHVNIRTTDLQGLSDFYRKILGLTPGPRPAFPFDGAWLYCGEIAVVHLVSVEERPQTSGLQLEHFAFLGDDLKAFVDHLDAEGVAYRMVEVADFGITQVNAYDPDGNHFHVDFYSDV